MERRLINPRITISIKIILIGNKLFVVWKMIESRYVRRLIKQGEGTRLEWKDSRILENPFKLARSLVAIANSKGGTILIGVRNDGSIEAFVGKKEHEEHIMNISTNNCDPPVSLSFSRVEFAGKGEVYVLEILKRRKGIFHGVKTRDGLVYFIRLGSTIREMRPHELSGFDEAAVEVEPYAPSKIGLLWLSKKLLTFSAKRLNMSPIRVMLMLMAFGFISMAGGLLLLFRFDNGKLEVLTINYPWWVNVLIIVLLIIGAILSISIPTIAFETRCPDLKSLFSYKKTRSLVLEKRRKN